MKKILLISLLIFSSLPIYAKDSTCVSGDCKNGEGTMVYTNGDLYTGQFKRGLKNGKGYMIYNDGMKFEGEWRDDKTFKGVFTETAKVARINSDKNQKPIDVPIRPVFMSPENIMPQGVRRIQDKLYDDSNIPRKPLPPAIRDVYEKALISYYKHAAESYSNKTSLERWQFNLYKLFFVMAITIFVLGLCVSGTLLFQSYFGIMKSDETQHHQKKNVKEPALSIDYLKGIIGAAILIISIASFYYYMANVYPQRIIDSRFSDEGIDRLID